MSAFPLACCWLFDYLDTLYDFSTALTSASLIYVGFMFFILLTITLLFNRITKATASYNE